MKCPLCNSSDYQLLPVEGGFSRQGVFGVRNLECNSCRFVYSDFIHPQIIELFYEYFCRAGTENDVFESLRENAKQNGISQLRTMEPYLPDRLGRVLDFGGGSGEAARLFLPLADDVFITESDPKCIAHINEESRLTLLDGKDILNDEYVGFFDLVILSNVLEHMTHPVQRIQEFSRLLSEDGQLFVEVPNEAPVLRRGGFHCQQHICFFTPDTFRNLIETQGSFDIEHLQTCGASVEDIIKEKTLIHDFDSQNTPDGWVIRAMLKNSRPKTEIVATNFEMGEFDQTVSDMSQSIFLMTRRAD